MQRAALPDACSSERSIRPSAGSIPALPGIIPHNNSHMRRSNRPAALPGTG